ncbi:MAG: S41 family peptidase [Mangrovibacterium sp.]
MNIRLPIWVSFVGLVVSGCYETADDLYIETGSEIRENEELKNETVAQNRWLYQKMNEQYFWYKNMPDSSTLDFNQQAESFFDKLLSSEDRFSWIELNADYSGEVSLYHHYGLETIEYQTADGSTINRVLLVLPGSPAQRAGLKRGDWFTTGQEMSKNLENSLRLTKGKVSGREFYPEETIDLYAGSANTYTSAVSLDTMYQIEGHQIGYLFYNEFMDTEGTIKNPYKAELREIFASFKQKNITDFIIDLRYNPGGRLSICQYLCSLILPDEYLGKVSGYQEFNDKLAKKQFDETGNEKEILIFPSKVNVGGNNIGIGKIYAIVTESTASASESLINSLDPFIEVVKIGTKTCGKGVGSWTIQDKRYKWQIQPITFRYYNSLHVTVPATGLIPDVVADESSIGTYYELGDVKEYLLSIALSQITGIRTRSGNAENVEQLSVQKKQPFNRILNKRITESDNPEEK